MKLFKNNKDSSSLIKNKVWNGLLLTNSASKQINKLISEEISIIGLCLNIKKSGCAGYSYFLEKIYKLNDYDLLYKCKSIKLYVPFEIMPLIDGTKLDYIREGLNCVFKFNNPKAQYSCGCGESFGFK